MNLEGVFESLKEKYTPRKLINFNELDIHIEMSPPTSSEEMKILEACKDLEGAAYVESLKKYSLAYSIKKINDIDLDYTDLKYKDESGKDITISKYLYLVKEIDQWPNSLRDILFEAFSSLQEELEDRIRREITFERFEIKKVLSEKPKEKQFKKVEVPEEDEKQMNETEKLNKKVKEEVDQIETGKVNSEQQAIKNFENTKG